MQIRDQKWTELMKRELLRHRMYIRYVDDCRIILPAINKGWKWNGERFHYVKVSKEEEELSDAHYTTTQIAAAICSLVTFTGEDDSMFSNRRLPTLDTELWMKEGKVMVSFYEKPTVGNKVLNREAFN